jgi:hypothetical protein
MHGSLAWPLSSTPGARPALDRQQTRTSISSSDVRETTFPRTSGGHCAGSAGGPAGGRLAHRRSGARIAAAAVTECARASIRKAVPVRRRHDRTRHRPDPAASVAARPARVPCARCARLREIGRAQQRRHPATRATRLCLGRCAGGTGTAASGRPHRQSRNQRHSQQYAMAQGHQLPHAPGKRRLPDCSRHRLLRAGQQSRAGLGARGAGRDHRDAASRKDRQRWCGRGPGSSASTRDPAAGRRRARAGVRRRHRRCRRAGGVGGGRRALRRASSARSVDADRDACRRLGAPAQARPRLRGVLGALGRQLGLRGAA